MKTKKLLLTLMGILILQVLWAQTTQLKKWYISGKEFNMQATPPALTGTIAGATTGANGPQNGIYDETGAIQFYINGGIIYNKNGVMSGSLPSSALSNFGYDRSEYVIVPYLDNDRCKNKYYLFFNTASTAPSLTISLYAKTIEVNKATGSLTITNINNGSSLTSIALSGFYANACVFGSMAVSNIKSNKRYLYWVAGFNETYISTPPSAQGRVDKIVINIPTSANPSGLSAASNLNLPTSVYKCFATAEADLSADGTKLAWGCNTNEFYIAGLNSNGDYSGYNYTFTTVSNSRFSIRGVEFNQAGTKLFYTTGDYTKPSDGVYIRDIAANTSTYITGSKDYGSSQIERAYNGLMYVAKAGLIASIDPVSLSLGGANISVSPPIYPGGYVLPDQIDECNYDNYLFQSVSYNAAAYTASTSATWTPASNPISTSGQPIRIQNELRFSGAGTVINLQGMTFEFGENAKMIIGNGVTVNLYNSTLRAVDCAMMWEGVEVSNGGTFTSNSTASPTYPVSSFILDAHAGISTNSDRTKAHNITLDIKMTEFNANHRHILLINGPGGANIKINNNRFLHSAYLRDQSGNWGLLDPAVGKYGGSISVDIVNFLPNPFTNTTFVNNNLFHRGAYGVSVYRSSVSVQGNTFQSMNYLPNMGVAVNVNAGYSSNTINVFGNSFTSVYKAMYELYQANISFTGNTVHNTLSSAVHLGLNRDCKININNNTFRYCQQNAIMLYAHAGNPGNNKSEITVTNNQILNQRQDTGITIQEDGNPTSGKSYKSLLVNGNTMNDIAYGVKVFNVTGYQDKQSNPSGAGTSDISNNTITFYSTHTAAGPQPSDYATGIQLNTSKGLKVLNNTISTNRNDSWRNCGVQTNNTTSTLVRGNTIKAGRGISGIENAWDNNYLCNIFNQNVNGISLGDHKMRNAGDVHGVFTKESRDNTFNGSKDKDIELYIWHIPNTAAGLSTNINNNKWIFLLSPSFAIYPDPNVLFGNPPSTKHISYVKANKGGENNPCGQTFTTPPHSSIWGPMDPNNAGDVLFYWQWRYEYERELKLSGQSNDVFMNQLLDVEELMATEEYASAQQLISSMNADDVYQQNYITVYTTLLGALLPEYRELNAQEISVLEPIAAANPYTAGPAVYVARGALWREAGMEFNEIEDRVMPMGFDIEYETCFDMLPEGLSAQLIDNQGNTYPDITVTINTPAHAFVSGYDVSLLDPSFQYSFTLNYNHTPLPFLSIEDWQSAEVTYNTSICEGGDVPPVAARIKNNAASSSAQVIVYPNPAADHFTISMEGTDANKVEVSDLLGRVIYTNQSLQGKAIRIDSRDWSKGIYMIKVYRNGEVIQSEKLMKIN